MQDHLNNNRTGMIDIQITIYLSNERGQYVVSKILGWNDQYSIISNFTYNKFLKKGVIWLSILKMQSS